MSPDASPDRQAVWTRHWASGAEHSCAGSYGSTYGGCIAAFWRAVAAELPAPARLLDIASGSGAIPRLWRSLREGDAWDAVDLAHTAPPWFARAGAGVRFHAGVAAEALPFEAGRFDLVASQFGLEYADLARAVPELLRVLRPGGRVALALHHEAGRPVTLARVELAHRQWLEGPDGLLPAAAALRPLLVQARSAEGRARLAADPQAERARLAFNAAQDALARRAAAAPDGADVLAEVQAAVAAVLEAALQAGEAEAQRRWTALLQALADGALRLRELCACALDEGAAAALSARLADAGLRPRLAPLQEGPHTMAWGLRADPA